MKEDNHEKLKFAESSGNVFADLGFKKPDKYIAKVELARQINLIISKSKLKQKDAAKKLGVDQPKISALQCGRINDFSIERLISFLNKLDRDVEIVVKKKWAYRKSHGCLKVVFG